MDASKQEKINKLYENTGYFDAYGGSLLGFLFITFFIFLIWAYYSVMQTTQAVKDDWFNQRCNPKVIPFAGWINKPKDDGKTPLEFTSENFQFCTQSILTNMMGTILAPFNALLSQLTAVFTSLDSATDQSRGILANLRESVANIAKNIMNRILGVMIPLQRMMMAFTDSLAKTQAVMTAGLYTMLGSYYSLQSLMGSILEMIIKMLVALAAIIVGLWIVPFTWPAAAASTAVFLSISVPLSIIALFMTQVLHIHSAGIPKVPSCFDGSTPIQMQDGSWRPISRIRIGDVLFRGETVTSTMKLSAKNVDMYWIPSPETSNITRTSNQKMVDGVIVSGCHPMQVPNNTWFFQNKTWSWLNAEKHPLAQLQPDYNKNIIYCFNTTSKLIHAGGHVFCDWDELYGHNLEKILNIPVANMIPSLPAQNLQHTEKIFEYFENGLCPEQTLVPVITLTSKEKKVVTDTANKKSMSTHRHKLVMKKIKHVKLNDELWEGGRVYGLVDVLNVDEPQIPDKHLLTTYKKFTALYEDDVSQVLNKRIVPDYNYNIDGILNLK